MAGTLTGLGRALMRISKPQLKESRSVQIEAA